MPTASGIALRDRLSLQLSAAMSPKANASQPLAGNSIETNNYNSMKLSELRAYCGRKHGTPIKEKKK
jgi:hypothetical protein